MDTNQEKEQLHKIIVSSERNQNICFTVGGVITIIFLVMILIAGANASAISLLLFLGAVHAVIMDYTLKSLALEQKRYMKAFQKITDKESTSQSNL